jgi:hypothetical protein
MYLFNFLLEGREMPTRLSRNNNPTQTRLGSRFHLLRIEDLLKSSLLKIEHSHLFFSNNFYQNLCYIEYFGSIRKHSMQ